jgi:hypothetical protein
MASTRAYRWQQAESYILIAVMLTVAAFLWWRSAPVANELVGRAYVIDGHTIAIGWRHIRLEGIDALSLALTGCVTAGRVSQ